MLRRGQRYEPGQIADELGLAILKGDAAGARETARWLVDSAPANRPAVAPHPEDPAPWVLTTVAGLWLLERGMPDRAREVLRRAQGEGSPVAREVLEQLGQSSADPVGRFMLDRLGRILPDIESHLLCHAAGAALRQRKLGPALKLVRVANALADRGSIHWPVRDLRLSGPVVEAQVRALLGDTDPSAALLAPYRPRGWSRVPALEDLARPYQTWTYLADLGAPAGGPGPITGPPDVPLILSVARRVEAGRPDEALRMLLASRWSSRRVQALEALVEVLDGRDEAALSRLESSNAPFLGHPWGGRSLETLLEERHLEVGAAVEALSREAETEPHLMGLASTPAWHRQPLSPGAPAAEILARRHFRRALDAARGASTSLRHHEADAVGLADYRRETALAEAGTAALGRMDAAGAAPRRADLVWLGCRVIEAGDQTLARDVLRRLAERTDLATTDVDSVLSFAFGTRGGILGLPGLDALADRADRIWKDRLETLRARLGSRPDHPWLAVVASLASTTLALGACAGLLRRIGRAASLASP